MCLSTCALHRPFSIACRDWASKKTAFLWRIWQAFLWRIWQAFLWRRLQISNRLLSIMLIPLVFWLHMYRTQDVPVDMCTSPSSPPPAAKKRKRPRFTPVMTSGSDTSPSSSAAKKRKRPRFTPVMPSGSDSEGPNIAAALAPRPWRLCRSVRGQRERYSLLIATVLLGLRVPPKLCLSVCVQKSDTAPCATALIQHPVQLPSVQQVTLMSPLMSPLILSVPPHDPLMSP
jgi:hypothetical protein